MTMSNNEDNRTFPTDTLELNDLQKNPQFMADYALKTELLWKNNQCVFTAAAAVKNFLYSSVLCPLPPFTI